MTSQPTKNQQGTQSGLPIRAGVGLKGQHFHNICPDHSSQQNHTATEQSHIWPDIGWFEVHPENYMGEGGAPHYYLTKIREQYPLSLHGVGLSIGGAEPPSKDHIARLKILMDRYQPESFSEHLAWSSHEAGYFNDLLPLPLTSETLASVTEHIDQIQSDLGRTMLLENPSTYVDFTENTYEETDFLAEIVKRTGCGLLLDVNNVYVSCTNHQRDPLAYLKNYPHHAVGEIHLGGHAPDKDDLGNPLLIDAHDRAVINEVWSLYERVIQKEGPKPTLVEWDNDVPAWDILFAEAQRAEKILVKHQPHRDERNHDKVA